MILYEFLSGELPFASSRIEKVIDKVRSGKYSFEGELWRERSDEVKDLIKHMLMVDPDKRYSATQCLQHGWFDILEEESLKQGGEDSTNILELSDDLTSFDLQENSLEYLIGEHTDVNLKQLRGQFLALCPEGQSTVNIDSLQDEFMGTPIGIPEQDLSAIVETLESIQVSEVDYIGFLIAILSSKGILTDNNLKDLFKMLDTDSSGTITKKDLVKSVKKMGFKISNTDIDKIFSLKSHPED